MVRLQRPGPSDVLDLLLRPLYRPARRLALTGLCVVPVVRRSVALALDGEVGSGRLEWTAISPPSRPSTVTGRPTPDRPTPKCPCRRSGSGPAPLRPGDELPGCPYPFGSARRLGTREEESRAWARAGGSMLRGNADCRWS